MVTVDHSSGRSAPCRHSVGALDVDAVPHRDRAAPGLGQGGRGCLRPARAGRVRGAAPAGAALPAPRAARSHPPDHRAGARGRVGDGPGVAAARAPPPRHCALGLAMTPEEWQRVKAAFDAALTLPPGERARFLDSTCGADASLRAEVESWLAAADT